MSTQDTFDDGCEHEHSPGSNPECIHGPDLRASGSVAVARDVLPDGRIDHRGHTQENMGGYGQTVCVDCTTEDGPQIEWTVPYDFRGLPMQEGWRDRPYELIRFLCGMDSTWTVPETPAGGHRSNGAHSPVVALVPGDGSEGDCNPPAGPSPCAVCSPHPDHRRYACRKNGDLCGCPGVVIRPGQSGPPS